MKKLRLSSIVLISTLLTAIIFSKNVLATSFSGSDSIINKFGTLTSGLLDIYSKNNILFYDPTNCRGGNISGDCGGEITSEGNIARVKEVVQKYGTLAMNLQITYGVPWEFLIAQMAAESSVGTAGTAKQQARDGKFNWIGLTCGQKNKSTAKYANGITIYRRPANEGGGCYESYDSIELMMKSYASGDFFRNGNYDKALSYTDKNNYDMKMFARTAFSCYVSGNCNGILPEDNYYVQTTLYYIKNAVRPQAEELGWPTSEELQKQKNIPIGGRYPIGTSRQEAYDDTVTCSSYGGSSTSSIFQNMFESLYVVGDDINANVDASANDSVDINNIDNQISSAKGCATYDGDYPEYLQSAEPWGSMDYGGKTIGRAGCGAASMAMLATYVTGQDIYPQDVANLTKSSPYYATTGAGMANLDKKVCEQYGCEVITVPYGSQSDALTKLEQYLKDGYVIHLSGAGSRPYSSGGHYVGLAGYNDGNTMVLNSAFGGNKEYSLRDVVYNGMHGGAFSAIRGSKSGSGKCAGLCSSSSAIDSEGGLTKEQAQKLADYYNGNEVSVSTYGLPHGKKNCVSFTAFFVQHFTSVGIVGSRSWTTAQSGFGARSTVSVLKNELGFQTGTAIRPFTVFSITRGSTMCGVALCGHTGVIVGVSGDNIITVEAAYEEHDARVFVRNRDYFVNTTGDPFAYAESKNFNSAEMAKIAGN